MPLKNKTKQKTYKLAHYAAEMSLIICRFFSLLLWFPQQFCYQRPHSTSVGAQNKVQQPVISSMVFCGRGLSLWTLGALVEGELCLHCPAVRCLGLQQREISAHATPQLLWAFSPSRIILAPCWKMLTPGPEDGHPQLQRALRHSCILKSANATLQYVFGKFGV